MSTKAEEKKALEQIKGIVEKLGADSYVGWAFEGCFEMAEKNIEEDSACSWMGMYQVENNARSYFKGICIQTEKENEDLKEEIESLKCELHRANVAISEKSDRADKLQEQLVNAGVELMNLQKLLSETQSKADKMENEIIKLKVKVYDLMLTE